MGFPTKITLTILYQNDGTSIYSSNTIEFDSKVRLLSESLKRRKN